MTPKRASILLPVALSAVVLCCFASVEKVWCLEDARPPTRVCRGPALQVYAQWELETIRIENAQQTCEVLCELDASCTAFVFNSKSINDVCKLYRICEELEDGLPHDRLSILMPGIPMDNLSGVAADPSGAASDAVDVLDSREVMPASSPKECSQRPLKILSRGQLIRPSQGLDQACWTVCERLASCAASVFNDELTADACKLYSRNCPESELANLPGSIIVKQAITRTCRNSPIATYSMSRLDEIRGLKAPAIFPMIDDPADAPDESSVETCRRLCQESVECIAALHNADFAVACRLYDRCDETDGVRGDTLMHQPQPTCSGTPYKTIPAWHLKWSFVKNRARDPESACGAFCDAAYSKCQASLYNPYLESTCRLYEFCREVIVPTRNILRYRRSRRR